MGRSRSSLCFMAYVIIESFLLVFAGQIQANGLSPVCRAVSNGNLPELKRAVEKDRANATSICDKGDYPLDVAAVKGRADIAEYLAQNGIPLRDKTFDKMAGNPKFAPVLRSMAKNKEYQKYLPKLVEYGALNEQADTARAALATGKSLHGDRYPMAVASLLFGKLSQKPGDQQALKVLDFLYSNGLSANFEEQPGKGTILFLAVQLGDIEFTKLLIAKGANVNVKNEGNFTPLAITEWMMKEQSSNPQKKAAYQEIAKILKAKGAK